MSEHDVRETRGVIVDATDAVVAALSARLDALLASWQLAIDAKRNAPVKNDGGPKAATEVLAELEHQLADLERRCEGMRQASEAETQVAGDWERRAMFAVQDNHDDQARDALNHLRNHLDAARELADEAKELEVLRDSYRNAVKAVRVTSAATTV